MKIFIFATIFLAVCLSQPAPKPTPTPGLNLQKMTGIWNVAFAYNYAYNTNQALNASCWNLDISVYGNNTEVAIVESYMLNGLFNMTSYSGFVPSTNNAVWDDTDGGSDLVWLDADLIGYTWGLVASQTGQNALLLTKAAQASQVLVSSQVTLLQNEGYLINSTNYYIVNNTNSAC